LMKRPFWWTTKRDRGIALVNVSALNKLTA
jgi:hypothetical protein